MQYHYANSDNIPVGPVSEDQLATLFNQGTITPQTNIMKEGSLAWQPYSSLNVFEEPIKTPNTSTQSTALRECDFCGEDIKVIAKKCKHCGEILDISLRAAEEAKRMNNSGANQPMVFMNAGGAAASSSAASGGGFDLTKNKSRLTAALLAFFLGGIGIHKFYLGQTVLGVLYLVFFWTFIPSIIAILEGIIYLCSTERDFAVKYG